MKQQGWFCEQCGANGVVEYQNEDGPFAVAYRIEDAHTEASPDCPVPLRNLRVVNAEVVTRPAGLSP